MVNVIVAGILSFIIPGLGQAVAGDIKKGIIFFVIAIVLYIIMAIVFNHWVMYAIEIIYALYTAYDAYQLAQ